MRLLYIHGYNGDPYGSSYNFLKNACGDVHELFTIDYNAESPRQAIKDIFKFVVENNIDCVIGTSLGGFLTMNLYGVSRIVVNPCWDPANELYKIGYTGDNLVYKELLEEMTNTIDLEERNLCSGVFATEDELLGDKYVSTFQKYFKNTSFIKGGHKISEEMANYIIKVILPLHENEANDFIKKLKNQDNAPWL